MLTAAAVIVLIRLYSKNKPYIVNRKIQWNKLRFVMRSFLPEMRSLLRATLFKSKHIK